VQVLHLLGIAFLLPAWGRSAEWVGRWEWLLAAYGSVILGWSMLRGKWLRPLDRNDEARGADSARIAVLLMLMFVGFREGCRHAGIELKGFHGRDWMLLSAFTGAAVAILLGWFRPIPNRLRDTLVTAAGVAAWMLVAVPLGLLTACIPGWGFFQTADTPPATVRFGVLAIGIGGFLLWCATYLPRRSTRTALDWSKFPIAKLVLLVVVWGGCGIAAVLLICRISQRISVVGDLTEVASEHPLNIADPTLGFKLAPGHFQVTKWTLDRRQHITCSFDIGPDGYRTTSATPEQHQGQPEIWCFGCSFTFGDLLDNEATYPWLVQAALPQFKVRNLGIPGYGNVHALLQLRDAVGRGAELPRIAVVAYANFHGVRNVAAPSRLKQFCDGTGNRLSEGSYLTPLRHPYAHLDARGALAIDLVPFDFRRGEPDPPDDEMFEVTKAIFRELCDRCKKKNILPVLAFQRGNNQDPILSYCQGLGFAVVDMRVDMHQPGFSLRPVDQHPGPKAQQVYADRLMQVIQPLLARSSTATGSLAQQRSAQTAR
jgi:hypothetical protein